MIWKPIAEAGIDGTEYLLYFPKSPSQRKTIIINGRYAASDGGDHWWETPVSFFGVPTHFAELVLP